MWQKILIKFLQLLLFPIIDRLWDKVNDYLEKVKADKKAKEEADKAKKKMDDAKTAKEIDDAADDTLNNI